MKETITIERSQYKHLVELAKQKVELQSELLWRKAKYNELAKKYNLDPEEWALYYDFLANHWVYMSNETREKELAIAAAMANRTSEGIEVFEYFVKEREKFESEK